MEWNSVLARSSLASSRHGGKEASYQEWVPQEQSSPTMRVDCPWQLTIHL